MARQRNAGSNWSQWVLRNPIIVIDNGTVRTIRESDFKYFQPNVYPGVPKRRVRLPDLPPDMPSVVKFDDEGVMLAPTT